MNLNDLPKLLQQLEDRAGEQKALKDAFLEIGSSLADILSLLEKTGPDTAKAIAAALRGIRVEATMKAPDVTINVKPTPVEVTVQPARVDVTVQAPDIQVAAPVVHIMPPERSSGAWEFDFTYANNGVLNGMKARRA